MQSSDIERPASAAGAAPDGLKRKLVWVTVFRTVATALLLAALGVQYLSGPPREITAEVSSSFLLTGGVFVLTLIYGLYLRGSRGGPLHAYVQVLGDVAIATVLSYLTGGVESPFAFTYLLAIAAGSILLFQRGAFAAAATSFACYVLLGLGLATHAIPAMGDVPPAAGWRLGFLLLSNGLAQFLIAALTSYLARLLSTAGGQLSAREADVRQLVRLQRQILAAMPSGLITCDASGQITFINRAGGAILGTSSPAGQRLQDVLPGIPLADGDASRRELNIETADGQRVLGLSITALDKPEGARLVVFQDLTNLRRVETELRRADHLAALGRMAAQLAHEIKNPLASMRGSAQLIASDLSGDAAAARLAQILIRESDRLTRLVDDFLRFARPPAPALQECALDALVAETVEMVRADPLCQQVSLHVEAASVRARADPGQLRQVVLNLLKNALAAVDEAKGRGTGAAVRVRVFEADGAPSLSVWDSAGSIPATDLTRIFEPFFTTREKGTGLGLSTTHAIVRAHGGAVHVASSPAAGTEFVVTLPSPRGEP